MVTIILVIIAVGISVILHEVVHGYVAKYLGDTTADEQGRLTLDPRVHIDPIYTLALPVMLAILNMPIFGAAKPVPVQGHRLKGDEFGMALVAVMGPLTNLALAIFGGVMLGLFNFSGVIEYWWQLFISVNIGFFIFNMIPIPPLDGSRVLYAFAPEPMQNIMSQMERYGLLLILMLVILGFPLIGPFIQSSYEYLFTTLTSIG
jgi:Zn-dependent protease